MLYYLVVAINVLSCSFAVHAIIAFLMFNLCLLRRFSIAQNRNKYNATATSTVSVKTITKISIIAFIAVITRRF